MIINGAHALVTGANRGLGRELVRELLRRGAARVYAGARDPHVAAWPKDPRIVPVLLDVTDPAAPGLLAEQYPDVDLLVNNAGVAGTGSLVSGDPEQHRLAMETNFFGPTRLISAFAPVLAAHGGGAVVNVLSVLSWAATGSSGAYSASKAAAWSLTVSARAELRARGTQVLGAHMAYMDTGMTAGRDLPKTDPAVVAARILDGLESGAEEVLADEVSRQVKQVLAGPPRALEV